MNRLELSFNEMGVIITAIEEHKRRLRDRFDEEPGFIHPSTPYRDVLRKILPFYENGSQGGFIISHKGSILQKQINGN